ERLAEQHARFTVVVLGEVAEQLHALHHAFPGLEVPPKDVGAMLLHNVGSTRVTRLTRKARKRPLTGKPEPTPHTPDLTNGSVFCLLRRRCRRRRWGRCRRGGRLGG